MSSMLGCQVIPSLPLPFPPDAQQIILMRAVVESGATTALEGTDRHAAMTVLVDGGFLSRLHCPTALGVHQFQVTSAGLEVLQ